MAVFPSRKIVLPQRVHFVNFIESHGTEYIDTGFAPKDTTRVTATYKYISGVSDQCVFGARSNNASTGFLYCADAVDFIMFGGSYINLPNRQNDITDVDFNGLQKKLTVNGSITNLPSTAFSVAVPLLLLKFSEQSGSSYTPSRSTFARLYNTKIYDNGTLARDFRPCLDPAGVPCMYDMVSNQYFYNQGSGTFGYG